MDHAPDTRFKSPTQLPIAIGPQQSEIQKHYAFLREFLEKRYNNYAISPFLLTRATAAAKALGTAWNSPSPESLPASPEELAPWLEWLAVQQAFVPNGNEVIAFLAECVRRSDTNWIESIPPEPSSHLAPQTLNTLRNRGVMVPSYLTARGGGVLCFGAPLRSAVEKRYRTVYWTVALNVAENGEVPLPTEPDLLFNVGAFFDSNGDPTTFLEREVLESFFEAPWPPEALVDWQGYLSEVEKRWQELTGSGLAEAPLLFGSYVRDLRVELIVREEEIPSPLPKLLGILERMPELPPLTSLIIKGNSPAPARLASAPRHLFLGHMDQAGDVMDASGISDRKGFPLDLTQRMAATYAAAFGRGEDPAVLPVNGPPGTGKTSFLRAVLASYWVREAYQKAATPMLVVATGATSHFFQPKVGESRRRSSHAKAGVAGTNHPNSNSPTPPSTAPGRSSPIKPSQMNQRPQPLKNA